MTPGTSHANALRELLLAGDDFRSGVAAHYNIGVREATALSYLTARGALAHSELAADLHLSPAAVTALVDRLETAGLAERTVLATNRRRTLVSLTTGGRDLVEHTQELFLRCMTVFEDPTAAAVVLTTVASSLRAQTHAIGD